MNRFNRSTHNDDLANQQPLVHTNPKLYRFSPDNTTLTDFDNFSAFVDQMNLINCTGEEIVISTRYGIKYRVPSNIVSKSHLMDGTLIFKHRLGMSSFDGLHGRKYANGKTYNSIETATNRYVDISGLVKTHEIQPNDVTYKLLEFMKYADRYDCEETYINGNFTSQKGWSNESCYAVSLDSIKNSPRGQMYLELVDLVVGVCSITEIDDHPYMVGHGIKESDERFDMTDGLGFKSAYTKIAIVDPNHKTDGLWAMFPTGVKRIPRLDYLDGREEGIYVYGCENESDLNLPTTPMVAHYTIEDGIDKLHLFQSRKDAEGFFTMFKTNKVNEENELKKKELEKETIALKERIRLHEREIQLSQEKIKAQEIELEKLKAENEKLSMERKQAHEERKDYYEEKSYARKDTSETLKWIPLIVTGAVAAFALLKRIFKFSFF